MKRSFFQNISVLLASMLASTCLLTACDDESDFSTGTGGSYSGNTGGDSSVDETPTEYTIQYADDEGVHTLYVSTGELYAIETLPIRNGYDFMGLFDAESGGTQYVNAKGNSLSVFTANRNLVLYPQFQPKEYTLILDYQGAPVTGSRSMRIKYDEEIEELPTGLTMEDKSFVGWYTEPNRGGTCIADEYGVLPAKNKLTERNFDLSDPDGNIYLYAGFKSVEYTVSFYFGDNPTPEEVKVEHGTHISQVQTETRVDGKAVLTWSKTKDGSSIFSGKITEDNLVLYAAEYAPVLDFDSNGGKEVASLVARAGSEIVLPTPTKENYNFVGWKTDSGAMYTYNTMPQSSMQLTAVWNAIIKLNENGGMDVTDVSLATGAYVALPECTRDGYIFAGWYLGDEKYESTAMPEHSITLKAGWYKILTEKITVINATERKGDWYMQTVPNMDAEKHSVDLSKLYNAGVRLISITAHYKSQIVSKYASNENPLYNYMKWYSTNIASEAYEIWAYGDEHTVSEQWESYNRTTELTLTSPTIYICRYGSSKNNYEWYYWTDFWLEIEYPDMTNLYL